MIPDVECGHCGAEMEWIECEKCGGEGVVGHDCGEDSCCCIDPEDNVPCDICNLAGGWHACVDNCLAGISHAGGPDGK